MNEGGAIARTLSRFGMEYIAALCGGYITPIKMNGGEAIARTLSSFGIEYIATLCGGHITPINLWCQRNGIRVLDFRHEAHAGSFAIGTSTFTGFPGVVTVTAGPGVTNVFTMVKTAKEAGVPLVVIGGAAPSLLKGRGSLQDTNQLSFMRVPHTVKWARVVRRVRDIPKLLEEAFQVAMSGVPGPVYIECPVDVLYDPEISEGRKYQKELLVGCGKGIIGFLGRIYIRHKFWKMWGDVDKVAIPNRPVQVNAVISESSCRHMAEILKMAERPVMVLGSEIMWSPKVHELQSLLERLKIPVYLTGLSRGLLGREHELLFSGARKFALKEADVVILAGSAPDFRLGYGQGINRNAKVIRVGRDPARFSKNRKAKLSIKGDVGEIFSRVVSYQESKEGDSEPYGWNLQLRAVEEDEAHAKFQSVNREQSPIDPVHLCQEIAGVMSQSERESIIVVDGGDFVGTAAKILRPNGLRSWIDAGPFGTLGTGAGFAMAAKAAFPEKDVWAMFGDGAFGYSIAEIGSASKAGLPFIAVIGNDARWTQIQRSDEDVFGEGESVATALEYYRYDAASVPFGATGLYAYAGNQVADVCKQALHIVSQTDKPVVLNVKIKPSDFRKGSLAV